MAGKGPHKDIEDVFNTMRVKHHIYAVATQECCHSILTSFLFNSKSEWKNKINEKLGRDFHEIACVSMNAMNVSIYAHSSVRPYVNSTTRIIRYPKRLREDWHVRIHGE